MEFLFWTSLILLYYIYDGYLRVLQVVKLFVRNRKASSVADDEEARSATVLLTAYNEAGRIADRLTNILESDYPREALSVLVASDGSTDGTDEIVRQFPDPLVRLFRSERHGGKTDTQNQAFEHINSEIVVFTDTVTRFHKDCLGNLSRAFADPRVGGVTGHLLFVPDPSAIVSEYQNFYWGQELKIRELESLLGILCVSSGQCMAARRSLIRQMQPHIGEDCIIPLDVVAQGYKVAHVKDAFAYDRMDRSEQKTRARMTLRNWQGTWSRSKLLNPFCHPGYAFSLWSHKLLRWLSPVFLIALTISAASLALSGQIFFVLTGMALSLFYLVGAIGWILEVKGLKLAVVSGIFSFLLANIGFMNGLLRALLGKRITYYR